MRSEDTLLIITPQGYNAK